MNRPLVVRLAAAAAIAALATTAWVALPVGVASAAGRGCRAGVTYRLLTPTARRTVVVTVSSANVRRGPGTDCARLTAFRRGVRLAATGARAQVGTSTWLQVTGGFGVGWVAATLVR